MIDDGLRPALHQVNILGTNDRGCLHEADHVVRDLCPLKYILELHFDERSWPEPFVPLEIALDCILQRNNSKGSS